MQAETSPEPAKSVSAYPMWKRTLAVGWVLFFCFLAAGTGIAFAGLFSFSGY